MKKKYISIFLASLFIFLTMNGATYADTMVKNNETVKKIKKMVHDAVIVSKINISYLKDKQLSPFKIHVSSDKGHVKLKGNVDTVAQYQKAIMLAESTEGVKDVKAELKVKESKQPLKDIYITAKVKGKLIKNKIFGDKNVEYWTVYITTKNGTVFLKGSVDNEQQKNNIISIAKNIDGVKSVNASELTIESMKE